MKGWTSVPSRGTSPYPTKRENHRLKSTFWRGYVSSLEGNFLFQSLLDESFIRIYESSGVGLWTNFRMFLQIQVLGLTDEVMKVCDP